MTTAAVDGLPPLRDVIARHQLSARKSLGQNFLLDLNLTSKIARSSGSLQGAEVLEIGPGPGGLTRALLSEGAARVVAVERDARCLDALAEIAAHYPERLEIIEGDALEIDPRQHFAGPPRIVSNLPYNIGTALFVRWLGGEDWPPWWSSLTLLFQREVVDRIVAQPGTKAYGRLSVLSQWRSIPRRVFDIPPEAFTPAPKVTSSVVHVAPSQAPVVPFQQVEAITAQAFAQRRKMLRQSLKSIGPGLEQQLRSIGVEPTQRAETLSVDQFVALARVLSA